MELTETAKLMQVKARYSARLDISPHMRERPCFDLAQCCSRAKMFSLLMKRSNVIATLAIICLLLATSVSLAEDNKPSPLEEHGRALAERMCSQCHAVGKSGRSPHVGAPPFRALDRRVDLDTFMDRLREGLMVDHPDMPTFRFSREDARAFLLYLRSIQAP
jgi:mono/diheme cytochrome c family protein